MSQKEILLSIPIILTGALLAIYASWPMAVSYVASMVAYAGIQFIHTKENPELTQLKVDVKALKEKMDAVTLVLSMRGTQK